jgi:hypothetical protein
VRDGGGKMMYIKKALYFKVISFVLIFLFLFQAEVIMARGEKLGIQFERAKSEYKSKKYEKAATRLERLAALYENVKNRIGDIKLRHGQTLLLLGASQEKLQQTDKAEENYFRSKELLGKDFVISGLRFKKMKIYKKIRKSKGKKDTVENRVIEKVKKNKKKNKKFPWMMVIGGIVVVGILAYLLTAKKSKKNLTVNLEEGVKGDPPPGTHKYKKGTSVNYNYSLKSGYTNLVVLLDGQEVSSSGTIKMDNDHQLNVSAREPGSINVKSTPTGARIYLDGSDTGHTTNSVLSNIVSGSHHIKVTREGYRIAETSVVVEPRQEASVEFTLTPDSLAEALDTFGTFITSGRRNWTRVTNIYYYGSDSAESPGIGHDREASFETTVSGFTSIKFYWRVSSENNYDYLEFYIDGALQDKISGDVAWHQKSYTVSSGSHTLKWSYAKDNSFSAGSDCGWVDKLELK